jgi:hypothetical protein
VTKVVGFPCIAEHTSSLIDPVVFQAIGYDMDYTLIHYNILAWEVCSGFSFSAF